MKKKVLLVGCRNLPDPRCAARVARLGVKQLFTESLIGAGVIVFGIDAVKAMEPETARSVLGRSAAVAILCVGTCDGPTLLRVVRWTAAGFSPVVEPSQIEQALAARLTSIARPAVALSSWLPKVPPPQSEEARIADALPRLEKLSVDLWARAVGRHSRTLARCCLRAFGLPPRELIADYRLVVAMKLREQDRPLDECAAAADLKSAESLLRICRRRGIEMPSPRGRPRHASEKDR